MARLEFYTYNDELWCIDGAGQHIVTEENTDLIDGMYDVIRTFYEEAWNALSREYASSSLNVPYHRYLVVRRFCKCNFGSLDSTKVDVTDLSLFNFEKVSCPLRGECKLECVVCNPKATTSLTKGEHRVMSMVYDGLTKDEIASRLFISPFTVVNHIKNSYKKLGVHTESEFLLLAKNSNMFNN